MRNAGVNFKSFTALAAGTLLLILSVANGADAQTYRSAAASRVDPGTNIIVRTNESIETDDSDGRVYMGVVEQDVLDRNRRIAIPRGSDVEMIVRETSNGQVALDLESVMVNGRRYGVTTEENVIESERKDGIGANKRTGKYVGGGAAIGAIIGAIAGGGKGAAIGAGVGAGAGAGAQVLTRGDEVDVPAESLLTFRLAEPLRAGVIDNGYLSNGVHYHRGYSPVKDQNVSSAGREKPGYYGSTASGASITIGSDKNIRWYAPAENATVYVQVDNNPWQLFASGRSGIQEAPWIENGHVYTFVLRDVNGNEIARDRQNTGRPSYRR